jgi:early secretory antigenic target protein ESAT-6
MQSMSVDPAQVIALAGQIRNGSNGIRAELDKLESEVNKLKASWGGQAQQSYDAAQRSWSQSVGEMQALLTQIATKTEDISQQYTQSDNSSAGRFAI